MTPRGLIGRAQDRMLASFGRAPADRDAVVRSMLAPKRGDAIGYWLQLVIATMLATLGLALSSTAVVIGAMLIAPLMRPLVELAMGLATGSAALALRATVRVVSSIAVVVMTALAITWLLPFHEITAELAARTAPSLLDLAVAAACALAAAYATVRADGDIATTAAGTSIGISLVPPLCAAGYGISIGDLDVARGAALLFTANLSGILAVATVMFVCLGFSRVDIRGEEAGTFGEREHASVRVGRAWNQLASKRLGPFARIVPPLVLIGLVIVPLQRAVGEITHRSKIRVAIADLMREEKRRVVQYSLDHTASDVIVRAVVVGDARTAADLEGALRSRLAELDVEDPKLSVWAVPDAASVSALARRVDEIPPPATPEPAAATVLRYTSDLAAVIRRVWPADSGELIDIALDLDHPDRIRIVHLGAPLGSSGLQLLASAIESHAGKMVLTEEALAPIEAASGDGASWLPRALVLASRADRFGLHACIVVPRPPPVVPGRKPPVLVNVSEVAVRSAIDQRAATGSGMTVIEGDRWSASVSRSPCVVPADPAAQAPAP